MNRSLRTAWPAALASLTLAVTLVTLNAQDRLRTMPGYDQFTKMSPLLQGTFCLLYTSPSPRDS